MRGEDIEISYFPVPQKQPEWRSPWSALGPEKVFMFQDGPEKAHRPPRWGLVSARSWRMTQPRTLDRAGERKPSEQKITKCRGWGEGSRAQRAQCSQSMGCRPGCHVRTQEFGVYSWAVKSAWRILSGEVKQSDSCFHSVVTGWGGLRQHYMSRKGKMRGGRK